jgi:hypothetical protein
MAEASAVFEGMFTLPTIDSATGHIGDQEAQQALVTQLTEPSRILDHLLRLIYPVKNPVINTLDDTLDVVEAASKYLIDYAVEEAMKSFEAAAQLEPLRAYAMACARRREDAARIAAKACLLVPYSDTAYVAELEYISAGDYVRLQEYRRACGAAASGIVENHYLLKCSNEPSIIKTWRRYTQTAETRSHPYIKSVSTGVTYVEKPWWKQWKTKTAQMLSCTPHFAVTSTPDFLGQLYAMAAVERGSDKGPDDDMLPAFKLFTEKFTTAINDAISKVSYI